MTKQKKFSLAIHGGAGLIVNKEAYKTALFNVLTKGRAALENGKPALDVVELCVKMLEDNPIFNAGKGSVLNEAGKIELDASIMDGITMSAGAVAAVSNIKNPVSLARRVMEKSGHVFLIGSGAMEFAKKEGIEMVDDAYFLTEARRQQWEKAREENSVLLDHSGLSKDFKKNKLGTVGAVAFDMEGNLAAATSTGGMVNKRFGRVGDSSIIGSGVFADNSTCGVSCTGIGEHIIRVNLSKMVSDFMLIGNLNVQGAAKKAINYFVKKINGVGGFIAIGNDGNITCEFTTPQMIYGYTNNETQPKVFA